jgi:hypothetical protein
MKLYTNQETNIIFNMFYYFVIEHSVVVCVCVCVCVCMCPHLVLL